MRKQRSSSAIGFTRHDIQRLNKGLKAAVDKRYYQRVQCVLAVAAGMAAAKVCKLTGSSLKSVYNYVNAYLSTHQLYSLCAKHPVADALLQQLLLVISASKMRCSVILYNWVTELQAGR